MSTKKIIKQGISLTLNELFPSSKRNKRVYNNSSFFSQTKSNIYTKKGTIKENQLNLLYNLTHNKLNQEYINKLSQLLYDCKSTKNYSLKRINLDKAVYKYDKNNELYITLPNFNYKNRSITYDNNKNNSLHNFTENGSNYLTNDTNFNISNYNQPNIFKDNLRKKKINVKDVFGKQEEEKLEQTIKKLLLNEDMELPKNAQKQIFNQLKMKYKFEESTKNKKNNFSQQKSSYRNYNNTKKAETETSRAHRDTHLIFPQINSNNNKLLDYLYILKTKTDELNTIKQRKYKNYLSPIFFLGKNRANYLNNIKYTSFSKLQLINAKAKKDFKTINQENEKFLKIMGNDINTLSQINNENKDILGQ